MAEYTEKDLENVKAGMDPRFVSTNIPEAGMQVDELSEEQLMSVYGGIPYEYAAEMTQENEAVFREAAVDRTIAEMEKGGDEVPTVSNGGMRR